MNRYGHNRGFIDELYTSFLSDPTSVSEAWRDYFADYRPEAGSSTAQAQVEARSPAPVAATTPQTVAEGAKKLVGISARIAENMVDSLGVPTATSARTIPVKMLEENRRTINLHQQTVAGAKISFTHVIAWAIVRALSKHTGMNVRYTEVDGAPHRIPSNGIHFGLAVDLERKGERVLLVPNIKHAEQLDFPAFIDAFNDRVDGARNNRLAVDDYQGTTVTLTNPGMIGTALSVPRLMQNQGTIIGVGAIGYPAEYAGMAPAVVSQLGLSKVMTVTSTYDHRVIQGAESGALLAYLQQLLWGGEGFYDRIFNELGVAHEPVLWTEDRNQPLAGRSRTDEAIAKQAGVLQLMRAYRVRGHLWADLDPLGYHPEPHPELELSHYGLTVWDLDRRFISGGLGGSTHPLTLRRIMDTLNQAYCRHTGVEYMHIQDTEPRRWLQERLEHPVAEPFDRETKIRILKKLNAAEAFESFLGTNYVGQKRFSLEGAETLIPMLDQLLHDAGDAGVEELVVGMAHRGRLNVLANVIGKSYGQIFREFEGDIDPETTHGSGDVKYHLGANGTYDVGDGRSVRVALASNPSHLEAVNPVVEGYVRALQDRMRDAVRDRVIPVLIHGDAAFAGQGVVAETLNLSQLQGYRTGGTVHIVVNNRIGFTTGPADARSSFYSTDVAKMLRSPIFHVNGDHPESAVCVMQTAFAYRQQFKSDVVIDLVCYRRWGHNEGDDPSYTHPILYSKIQHHRSVRKLYTDQLLRGGDFDLETAEKALEDFRKRLRAVHDEVREIESAPARVRPDLEATEGTAQPRPAIGLEREMLEAVLDGLGRTPEGFQIHPKLGRQLAQRRDRFDQGRIDWALAETLAFGTLALEGVPVRLSGEDSGRGTFSQRHVTLYDYSSAEPYVPLSHLDPEQAPFNVYDSLLSEFAVLGFEYGYSVAHPEALVMWEAQFGDFVNGAQVILDQFIASAEDKWDQRCGVVLLLPHGYEGQGPEHSSARIERFLQLAARGNIQVVVPSTPGQYFHLLRAQANSITPKPLVVITPKSLLRHRDCVSTAEELVDGSLQLVLDDAKSPDPAGVKQLVLCSGKIYYDLEAHRGKTPDMETTALARVEQLYPFPGNELTQLLEKYPGAVDIVWAQEEPRNMGAWSFLSDRLVELLRPDQRLRYAGRPRAASPAAGSLKRHLAEQEALVTEALEGKEQAEEREAAKP